MDFKMSGKLDFQLFYFYGFVFNFFLTFIVYKIPIRHTKADLLGFHIRRFLVSYFSNTIQHNSTHKRILPPTALVLITLLILF